MNQDIQHTLFIVVAELFYMLQMKSENMFWFQNHFVTRKVEDFEIYIPV
jgi:hypothetical protein